ncbi:hypothetical protein GCM10025873_09960 [Demequina sediminis]|nr:hypothetical protein GCM10025873_09960 [Demequina sediminis]
MPSEWIGMAEHWAASFRDTWRARTGVLALYLAVAAAIVIPVVLGPGSAMSRIDEPTHADYAWKAAHLEVPFAGSVIAPEIRDIWACVGQERYVLPACGEDAQAWQFPYSGQQYNFSHPRSTTCRSGCRRAPWTRRSTGSTSSPRRDSSACCGSRPGCT